MPGSFDELKRQKDAIVKLNRATEQRKAILATIAELRERGIIKTEKDEDEWILGMMRRMREVE